ncbi:MAG: c-type cytochrome [Planctomycetota bacterium]|jgi:mono/diheme cytochrome c family protein
MEKQSSIEESVHQSGENGRRNFLKICSVILSSLIGIGYAIPLIRAFISPAMQNTVTGSSDMVGIGNVNEYQINTPKKIAIKDSLTDAWTKFLPTTMVFMLFIILGFGLTGCQPLRDQKGELVENGIPPQGEVPVVQNDLLYLGEQLFRQHCMDCHSFEGAGGNSASDMTAYNSKPWLTGFIQDTYAPKYYGNTNIFEMPEFDLEKDDLNNLVEFLLAQANEDKEIDPVLKETGEMILEQNSCYNCHTYDGKGRDDARALDNYASDKWLRSLIEDPGEFSDMPAYKDKLSKQEIDNLVYFLQSLRKESH